MFQKYDFRGRSVINLCANVNLEYIVAMLEYIVAMFSRILSLGARVLHSPVPSALGQSAEYVITDKRLETELHMRY